MSDLVLVIAGLSLGLLAIYLGALGIKKIYHLRMKPKMRHGEILTADEMKNKYNLTIENYKSPNLDPNQVPDDLRDLLPIAKKWGIGDDIIRDDMRQKSSTAEKRELINKLEGKTKRINNWLDTFDDDEFTPESTAFLYLLLCHEEILVLDKP
jgi:hypothetical protein